MEYLLEAERNGSIEAFLKSDDIEQVIVTGAELELLQTAAEIIDRCCKRIFADKDKPENIVIKISENIEDCFCIEKKTKVVSLNYSAALNINKNTKAGDTAILAKDLSIFFEFLKVDKINEMLVMTWKNLFGYETAVFGSSNKYINRLGQVFGRCGIQAGGMHDADTDGNDLSPLEALLFSKGGKYCEKIKITDLMKTFEWLSCYKQISGYELKADEYLEACIECIRRFKQEGFSGILFKAVNAREEKLRYKIREEHDFEVVDSWENVSPGKKYLIDESCLKGTAEGSFIFIMREHFFKYICESAIYNRINKLCRNVYIYPAQMHLYGDYKTYLERSRFNFIHNRTVFPDNFVKEICGDENYPLDEVLRNMEDCRTVKINDGYIKFMSNYSSKYFNTNTYGSRITVGEPAEYTGTVWLAGACNFIGYAVEDKHIPASLLQKK